MLGGESRCQLVSDSQRGWWRLKSPNQTMESKEAESTRRRLEERKAVSVVIVSL